MIGIKLKKIKINNNTENIMQIHLGILVPTLV